MRERGSVVQCETGSGRGCSLSREITGQSSLSKSWPRLKSIPVKYTTTTICCEYRYNRPKNWPRGDVRLLPHLFLE